MIPGVSWIPLGKEVKAKWEATPPDYYGAGKTAGQLAFQVVGDVASVIPVVKGAMVAAKLSGTVLKTTIRQVLKGEVKAGVKTFTRGVVSVTDEVLGKRIAACENPMECFPAGTLVVMADGSRKPIEQIVAGDFVLADDPTDSQLPSSQLVESVQTSRTQYLTHIQLDAKNDRNSPTSLIATSAHPVWTVEDGWIPSRDVRPGQHLLDVRSQPVAVHSTIEKRHPCDTWNLTVALTHAFFVDVGGATVLVHNTKPGPRAYIIYQGKYTHAGVEYAYTGKASMLSGTEYVPEDILKKRYKNGFIRRKLPGTKTWVNIDIKTNVEILDHFHSENGLSGLSTKRGAASRVGDELAHGLEGAYAKRWKMDHPNTSLNTYEPLGDNAANREAKILRAKSRVTLGETRTCLRFPYGS